MPVRQHQDQGREQAQQQQKKKMIKKKQKIYKKQAEISKKDNKRNSRTEKPLSSVGTNKTDTNKHSSSIGGGDVDSTMRLHVVPSSSNWAFYTCLCKLTYKSPIL
jgi:hypothetical protein